MMAEAGRSGHLYPDIKEERGLIIREVRPGDRAGIVSVTEGCGVLGREEKDCAIELLDIYLNEGEEGGYLFLLAGDGDGEIAGYICYGDAALAEGVFELYWIVVKKDTQGRGAGTMLLERAEEEMRALGARMLVAETSSLPGYDRARRFYIKRGFREEARVRDFFKPGDDKVIYVKNL